MSSSKRKQPTLSSNDCDGEDDDDNDPPMIRGITASLVCLPSNKYGAVYTVTFTKPCCEFHCGKQRTRILVNSKVEFFASGADTAVLMMEKTIKAIDDHKKEKKFDGIEACNLSWTEGIGALYMKPDVSPSSLWRLLWASVNVEIMKKQLASYQRSEGQTKRYKKAADNMKQMEWERGDDFDAAWTKSRAIQQVEDALVKVTQKSTVKATTVLSDLVSKLTRSGYFDENDILTEKLRLKNAAMSSMFEHAAKCIAGLKGRGRKGKQSAQALQLLTGVSSLFIPMSPSNVSKRKACNLLGLNRNTKYVKMGMENRLAFDKYLELEGDIAVGEMVQCRGGYGELKESNVHDDSIIISLHPWNCDTKYQPKS